MASTQMKNRPQIRSIWGLAKSKELDLSKEELYTIIYRETGKESMKELSIKEMNRVLFVLIQMKEKQRTRPGMATDEQIWKIHELEKSLGWSDNPRRLKGFVKKYYKTEKLEWLKFDQASKLIESLKKTLKRMHDGL